jgi:hypothetical protein
VMAVCARSANADEALADLHRRFLANENPALAALVMAQDSVILLRDSAPDVLVLEPELLWGWGVGARATPVGQGDMPAVAVIVLSARSARGTKPRKATFLVGKRLVLPAASGGERNAPSAGRRRRNDRTQRPRYGLVDSRRKCRPWDCGSPVARGDP